MYERLEKGDACRKPVEADPKVWQPALSVVLISIEGQTKRWGWYFRIFWPSQPLFFSALGPCEPTLVFQSLRIFFFNIQFELVRAVWP